MATEKYPQQNHNMPMKQDAVDAARARLGNPPSEWPAQGPVSSNGGKGSRRQSGPNTWIDDRVIPPPNGRELPSADSPPEMQEKGSGRSVPASFDPLKAYQVEFAKPAVHAGRTVAPGKSYIVAGEACAELQPAMLSAVEVGDIPPVVPEA